MRRHTNSISEPRNTSLPVLVHCSAGVGRTGVVIMSEILIACLDHNEASSSPAREPPAPSLSHGRRLTGAAPFQMQDIPNLLLTLRAQRMMMVQTFSQYQFIYKVLINYLHNSRLI